MIITSAFTFITKRLGLEVVFQVTFLENIHKGITGLQEWEKSVGIFPRAPLNTHCPCGCSSISLGWASLAGTLSPQGTRLFWDFLGFSLAAGAIQWGASAFPPLLPFRHSPCPASPSLLVPWVGCTRAAGCCGTEGPDAGVADCMIISASQLPLRKLCSPVGHLKNNIWF